MPSYASIVTVAPPPLLTVEAGKLRAGLDWPAGDPRDDLMAGFIATATSKVELDSGYALQTQTREVYAYGALEAELVLPPGSAPLQSVAAIEYRDEAGALLTVDPAAYVIDPLRARIALVPGAAWPVNAAPFGAWTIRIVAGWADAASVPPLLTQAVGILVAHLATAGRDLARPEAFVELPYGYEDSLAAYRPVGCV